MKLFYSIFLLVFFSETLNAQVAAAEKIAVIAYYDGDATKITSYPVEKLTHIIFSFCHLKGDDLWVNSMRDSLTIKKLVSLKQRNPSLKVMLSMGGWGGCETCSDIFSADKGRNAFAISVKKVNDYFKTDGIDIDWEYPAIEGYPQHAYKPADKQNFTFLMAALRKQLGTRNEISFAAGGFVKFLAESVEWDKITPLVNKINLMTYDLVNGNSTITGHHTPLYSTKEQIESTDNAVRYLDSIGVPKNKMIIGAAMYARVFDTETDVLQGLYQPGKFTKGISYSRLNKDSLQKESFVSYWDDTAKAPYMYSSSKKQLITFDDERSMTLKTKYVKQHHLGGIMFWQLADDKPVNGLLDAIDAAAH